MFTNIQISYPRFLWLYLFGLFALEASAQEIVSAKKMEVTTNKTSSIIFPSRITDVDRGSRDILVQKAKGATNILKVKAGKVNFNDTNLTVITDDGTIYIFSVRYSSHPPTFAIQATDFNNASEVPVLFQSEITTTQLQAASEKIVHNFTGRPVKSSSDYDMKLALLGIYILDNTMLYHVSIANKSNIPFHTDMLRFYVKDVKKPKRTASQELVEHPIFHYGNTFVIKGKSSEELVYAIPKRTIPDAKVLTIELKEKNGGRHLKLSVKNKSILKARAIPE